MVSPWEAVAIWRKAGVFGDDLVTFCKGMDREVRFHFLNEGGFSARYCQLVLLSAMFNAGRIQGIREERRRKG